RSRRSGVAFQGRSWSPGVGSGAVVPPGGGAGGARGSGNLLLPLVGRSADGSSPALTAPCCPPETVTRVPCRSGHRPADDPGRRLHRVLGVPKGYREGLDGDRGFPLRPLTSGM